jgi:hypothetical protein
LDPQKGAEVKESRNTNKDEISVKGRMEVVVA